MKAFKPKKILVYRMDIEDALRSLTDEQKDTSFPLRFQWRAIGKKVKKVQVVCTKDKAVWVDIYYYEETVEKWEI